MCVWQSRVVILKTFSLICAQISWLAASLRQLTIDRGAVDETDWVKLNKAFRKNSGNWSLSYPGPRLVVMKNVMDATSHMVNKALQLSGKEWQREQELLAAQGLSRSFAMLEAARGADLEKFFTEILSQFHRQTAGIPFWAMTTDLLKNHFCMLSRAGCSMHFLLRKVRQGQPYRLFQMLEHLNGARYADHIQPECLNDELAAAFYIQFPEWSADAEVALRCLAQAIDLDIACIESKHALSRRLTCIKSLHTWATSFQSLSADWSHRQGNTKEKEVHRTNNQVNAAQLVARLGCTPAQHELRLEERENKKKQKKGSGGGGGGGGTFRAFLHVHHAGRKMTKESLAAAKNAYLALSADERAYFEVMGRQGTQAWRHGFHSFGERNKSRPCDRPAGEMNSSDQCQALVVAHDECVSTAFLPIATRDLQEDVKLIRSQFQCHRQKEKEKAKEEEDALVAYKKSSMESLPAVAGEGDPKNFFYNAFDAGTCSDHTQHLPLFASEWFPPASAMAQAPWTCFILTFFKSIFRVN